MCALEGESVSKVLCECVCISVCVHVCVFVYVYVCTHSYQNARLGWYSHPLTTCYSSYNNEWMVVDYKLFTKGDEELRDGLLWVLEQLP